MEEFGDADEFLNKEIIISEDKTKLQILKNLIEEGVESGHANNFDPILYLQKLKEIRKTNH